GVVTRVYVYSRATLLGTQDIIGTAVTPGTFGLGSVAVNLSAFNSVTRIEVVPPTGGVGLDTSYGGDGLVYDNFSFEPAPAPGASCSPVPSLSRRTQPSPSPSRRANPRPPRPPPSPAWARITPCPPSRRA